MNTTTLKDGIKAMCASLGAKDSNTTNGGVMLVNTSTGEPNGMMTMANLASVLGGTLLVKNIGNGSNIDDIKTPGIYKSATSSVTATLSGTLPSGFTNGFYLEVIGNDPYIHTIIRFDGHAIYRRGYVLEWSEWESITTTAL